MALFLSNKNTIDQHISSLLIICDNFEYPTELTRGSPGAALVQNCTIHHNFDHFMIEYVLENVFSPIKTPLIFIKGPS